MPETNFKFRPQLLFLLLFALLAGLALSYNSRKEYGDYRGTIYGDKGGYYSFLPFFITYGGNADALPDSARKMTGYGYSIEEGKLITKYPVGVALMEAPFFLLAEVQNQLSDQNHAENAFAGIYRACTVVSARG